MKITSDWQNGVDAGIHANHVSICVVKPIGVDAKSRIILGLRISSKVNWVQNNTNIDKHSSFLCHLLTKRQILIEEVQRHCVPTLNLLLFGDMSLNNHTNCTIFEAV